MAMEQSDLVKLCVNLIACEHDSSRAQYRDEAIRRLFDAVLLIRDGVPALPARRSLPYLERRAYGNFLESYAREIHKTGALIRNFESNIRIRLGYRNIFREQPIIGVLFPDEKIQDKVRSFAMRHPERLYCDSQMKIQPGKYSERKMMIAFTDVYPLNPDVVISKAHWTARATP